VLSRRGPASGGQDFHAAAAVFQATRATGTTVRSLLDCLIAVVAARHGATVVHRNRDYDVLATAMPRLAVVSLG
jgi:predicted nucleic acid-binding protein